LNRRFFAVACWTGSLSGSPFASIFGDSKLLTDIPLKWAAKGNLARIGPVDVGGPLLTRTIRVGPFVDARQNPKQVGENRQESAPKPVTTSSDVAAFLSEHMKDVLHEAGVNTVDGAADFTLSGEIQQLFVTETDLYRGEASLAMHLKNVAGKELWSSLVSGAANSSGRSYNADNYYETISETILRTTYNLLTDPGFHEALTKR
jgi:hypothetical protein